jgi:hypothetical protein
MNIPIETLCKSFSVAESIESSVKRTLLNGAISDFEDGLEYYEAIENKCKYIITEGHDDFYFFVIEVMNSQRFFQRYMSRG